VSRGRDATADASGRLKRELRNLREKWGEALINDPFYSPLLALNDPPYSALAWPPRSLRPRTRLVAPPRNIPAGF
jgi:O-antigen biosynthesis protein